MKYKLTFWQKLELIPLGLMWLASDPDKRKPWHEVKKGLALSKKRRGWY